MNPQIRRMILDLGPLLVFFAALKFWGFFIATAIFMVLIIAALTTNYIIERKISPVPLFTAILVLIFGGLTLYLNDKTFFKMKVTFVYCIFAIVLLAGLAARRLFIKYVFEQAFDLDEAGWRKLTWRWGIFLFCLAALNEVIWRNVGDDTWALSKIGFYVLILVFAAAQTPLVLRHGRDEPRED